MGIDRWELEHRSYRPGQPVPTEVTPEDRLLDVPEDLPVEDSPIEDLPIEQTPSKDSPIPPQPAPATRKRDRAPKKR